MLSKSLEVQPTVRGGVNFDDEPGIIVLDNFRHLAANHDSNDNTPSQSNGYGKVESTRLFFAPYAGTMIKGPHNHQHPSANLIKADLMIVARRSNDAAITFIPATFALWS